MSAESIQVELVGQAWWSAALPIIAILISLASIAITLWFKFRDDARIQLSASRGYVLGVGDDKTLYVHLEATNVGRSGTTVVQTLKLVLPDGQGVSKVKYLPMDSVLPASLGPGETAHAYMPLAETAELLVSLLPGSKSLHIESSTGHGRTRAKIPDSVLRELTRQS